MSASTLDVGTPTSGGLDFVWIHDSSGWHLIPVTITLPGDALPGAKAVTIATAIQDAGFSASATTGGNVDIAKGGSTGVDKWEYHSYTGEADQAQVAFVNIGPPQYFAMGFDGTLSGSAFPGDSATYTASIGFDAFEDTSVISYASLTNQTEAGLLTATYDNLLAGLPSAYQSSLSLDLLDDEIVFTMPVGATDAFVSAQSLDASTGAFIGGYLDAATAPEPASYLMLGLGVAAICAGSWRKKSRERAG